MTLQEHYNSIVGGKGNKAQFLKQARHLFPQHITNLLDFDTTVNVLKSKQIISENTIGGVVSKGFNIVDWKKVLAEETEDYKKKLQQAVDFYRENLNMGIKAVAEKFGVEEAEIAMKMELPLKGLFESVKATEKNVSKEVEDYRKNAYNNADMKNADNVNFNEIMKGFYLELKNPKNHDKTVDELKDIVVKNLAKDALHYTKDGMFGVEGVGFTDEAPSLKQPVEPKGKHKSSGYGDLDVDVEKVKANVKDTLSNSEAKTSMPKKVKEMPVTPQNSAGVKKMKTPGAEKRIKLKEIVTGENPYFDTDPSDGDSEHDKDTAKKATYLYDEGKKLYYNGKKEEAEALRQQALKIGSGLSWTAEKDLPPYSSLKENTDNSPLDFEIWDKLSKEEQDDLIKNNSHDPNPHYGKSWSSLPDEISTSIARDKEFIKKKEEIINSGLGMTESISDKDIQIKYNEMMGKNPQTKFEDVAKALNLPMDKVEMVLMGMGGLAHGMSFKESKVRSLIAKLIKEELK